MNDGKEREWTVARALPSERWAVGTPRRPERLAVGTPHKSSRRIWTTGDV